MGQGVQAEFACLRTGRRRFDTGRREGEDFSSLPHVQTGPVAYSASCKISTWAFSGLKTTERSDTHFTSC